MHMNAANGTLIAGVAVQFGENFEIDGAVTINHARGIGLEGIVSERKRLSRCLGHVIFTHRRSEQNRTPRRRYSETRLSVGGFLRSHFSFGKRPFLQASWPPTLHGVS